MGIRVSKIIDTPLTPKQLLFAKTYVQNGQNGTKAATKAYNLKNSNVAQAVASENLAKPIVRDAIKKMLKDKGLTPDYVGEKLKAITEAGTDIKRLDNATVQDALKALAFVARFNGMLDKNTNSTKTVVKFDFTGKSRDEIRREVAQMGNKFNEYAQVIE